MHTGLGANEAHRLSYLIFGYTKSMMFWDRLKNSSIEDAIVMDNQKRSIWFWTNSGDFVGYTDRNRT
jgi:hypothetical protein